MNADIKKWWVGGQLVFFIFPAIQNPSFIPANPPYEAITNILILRSYLQHTTWRCHMKKLVIGDSAPDFALPNQQGTIIRLSDIVQQQNVLLVFNLGFA